MTSEFLSAVKTPSPEELQKEAEWVTQRIMEIGEERLASLAQKTIAVRGNAYQPYSNYAVGVAILCSSGEMYAAPNTEVVTYTQTGHAEHNAINKALSEGEAKEDRNFIEALVVCHSGNSEPCGACRQEIAEHCDNAVVINIDPEGKPLTATSLNVLLPYAFVPKHLDIE